MTVSFRDPFPIVYTDDPGRLAAFYAEAFGFELSFRFPTEPESPMEFGTLVLGGSELGLGLPVDPLHGKAVIASSTPATFELCLLTDDVDAAVERLRGIGVAVLYEPADQPWGERLAYVADPDGHPVMLYAKRS